MFLGAYVTKAESDSFAGRPIVTISRIAPAPIFSTHYYREASHMKPEDLQRLVTVSMPYGKYQGRLIADLPGAYLAWFARKGFPAGDLGNLLALMLELDHNGLKSLLDPLRKR